MPTLPLFLADFLEPRFATPVTVSGTAMLGPKLKRVRFESPALREVPFRPGQEVEFRVNPTEFRHYTPARFDAAAGFVDVIFFLHGGGPGSAWAEALTPGAGANLLGPGGGAKVTKGPLVLCGDETSLGLFEALGQAFPAQVALECEEDLVAAISSPSMTPLSRRGERGTVLAAWAQTAELPAEATYVLAGHAGTIQRVRAVLIGRGAPRRAIISRPYWATGKRGL
jgi:NADPH-dependent ferric siderophore reductase